MKLKIHSLSVRYLLTFSLLVLIPVFIFTCLINASYGRYQRHLAKIQMQETVDQMAVNINNEVAAVSILSSALNHNTGFLKVCDRYDGAVEPSEIYQLNEQLDLELSDLFLYTNKVGILYVFTKHKPVFLFRNFPMSGNLPETPQPDGFLQQSVESEPGFIHISDDFFSIYPESAPGHEPIDPLLIMAIRPKGVLGGNSIEKILFAYKIKLLDRIYENTSIHQFSFLSDAGGRILLQSRFHGQGQDLLNRSHEGTLDESRWLLLSSKIDSTGWILYHAADLRTFMQPFKRIQKLSYLILAGLFVFFIIYTVLFFQNMISPLNILIEKMRLVEEGDYSVQVPESGQSEMNRLFHSFNRMIGEVSRLTELKSRTEKERGQLELQALQYQINPHFIANTLNSIRLMAVVKKNDNIKKMTASLMQIINDSFRVQGNKSTLREETASLAGYVHIMKVRFSSPIELRFSIPGELDSFPILKMLLQPLVENSVVHGFAEKTRKGIILIQVRRMTGSRVMIRVCDNGCGMDLAEDSLPASPNTHRAGTLTKVGIQNVDRRIKLNYGEEYGLSIQSRKEFYTSIRMELPLHKENSVDFDNDCR